MIKLICSLIFSHEFSGNWSSLPDDFFYIAHNWRLAYQECGAFFPTKTLFRHKLIQGFL